MLFCRIVRQLHAAGCPRVPQLLAQHHRRPTARGKEPGKTTERQGSAERRRWWKRKQHGRGWKGGKDPADLGAWDLPRHADQWDTVPYLWSGESVVKWVTGALKGLLMRYGDEWRIGTMWLAVWIRLNVRNGFVGKDSFNWCITEKFGLCNMWLCFGWYKNYGYENLKASRRE